MGIAEAKPSKKVWIKILGCFQWQTVVYAIPWVILGLLCTNFSQCLSSLDHKTQVRRLYIHLGQVLGKIWNFGFRKIKMEKWNLKKCKTWKQITNWKHKKNDPFDDSTHSPRFFPNESNTISTQERFHYPDFNAKNHIHVQIHENFRTTSLAIPHTDILSQ